MVVQLIYKDGTEQIVERAFTVLDRTKKGRPRIRWVAQRAPGTKLQWLKPSALTHVNIEMDTEAGVPVPPPERTAA